MRSTSTLGILAISSLVLGCRQPVAPAEERAVAVQVRPVFAAEPSEFAQVISNPCNGDLVAIEGKLHLVFHTHEDAAGGSHIQIQLQEHGAGTGQTFGDTYSFSADTDLVANTPSPGSETSQIVQIRLIGHGAAPNFIAGQVLHFTVNGVGDVTGVVDKGTSECR